jgi:hypothetical protein
MEKALIKIAYKQVIDASSHGAFEQNVFNYSYNELWLKSQVYNPEGKFKTFTQLKANDGRANSLHYKSGFAIGGFVALLQNKIPIVQGSLGENILFSSHKFEVIESDVGDKAMHKIAIHYITGTLSFYGNIGEYMLLATGDHLSGQRDEAVETFSLKMQDNLSIVSYQPVQFKEAQYTSKKFGASAL